MIVAAVMPTFNQQGFLAEAIDSVVSQVNLLVVVDDASTDRTSQLLADRKDVCSLRHECNQGAAIAINTGVREAIGRCSPDWLTWVSSDNVYYADWMRTLLDHAEADVGAVYSGFDAVPETKEMPRRHYVFKSYDPAWLGQSINCYLGPNFIIRSDVWQDHRGLHSHDYDNWCRVEEACWSKGLRIVGVDKALCRYRMHRGQATRNHAGRFDAPKWLQECKKRREALGIKPP